VWRAGRDAGSGNISSPIPRSAPRDQSRLIPGPELILRKSSGVPPALDRSGQLEKQVFHLLSNVSGTVPSRDTRPITLDITTLPIRLALGIGSSERTRAT